MLLQLPNEVWMEILDFLRGHRREMAAKFNKLGDHAFSEIYQHWLHKYTKNVRLGFLCIESANVYDKDGKTKTIGLLKVYDDGRKVRVPFPQLPIPENVTGFREQLEISYLDYGVLNFLRKMAVLWSRHNSKICLQIGFNLGSDDYDPGVEELAMMRTAIGHLLPMFSTASLAPIKFHSKSSSIFSSTLEQFPQQLFSVKLLCFADVTLPNIPSIVRWLCTKRADEEPRMVIIRSITDIWDQLYEAIREQFLATTTLPVSFFIQTGELPQDDKADHKNCVTGEQLILRIATRRDTGMTSTVIGRCPSGVDENEWLQEMSANAYFLQYFHSGLGITLSKPLFGSMESDAEEEEAIAVVPSKKRRLTLS